MDKQIYQNLKDEIENLGFLIQDYNANLFISKATGVIEINLSSIKLNSVNTFTELAQAKINKIIEQLTPWRLGDYLIFNNLIKSEWNCDFRWKLIDKYIPFLNNKKVADIGANNGYFSFRLLEFNPSQLLCFEPNDLYNLQLYFIASLLKNNSIKIIKNGVENLINYDSSFDFILFMGVLYHRENPIETLKNIYFALKANGVAIVESICIEGDSDLVLFPYKSYAKMKNIWYIPSESVLKYWCEIAGFRYIQKIFNYYVTEDHQKKSEHSPNESLSDFLSEDGLKTVEGYPPPYKVGYLCKK